MCIIIDTNTINSVFKEDDMNHVEFKAVRDWIIDGDGIIIFGGTKYLREVQSYLSFLGELKKNNKAIRIEDTLVDQKEQDVSKKIVHRDFDDQHLIGLLLVSGCRLICSLDARAYSYFKSNILFSGGHKRPKIYSGSRNRSILFAKKNIANICKPCLANKS